ncbi:hypothetical protein G7076_00010 [Sphingomonas sp. HDW15A]|uniref:ImuA family protein n=1 Tax=Sphingomonas sp. HDW15A TaxID=2714942 RepID=UPI00140B759B|nr:hypothetical protein [Sphingomonas sp. HDW15A]QIK95085.1 hypothetical protein G7076_00010 [Sphingomonas sp. HDW15A]
MAAGLHLVVGGGDPVRFPRAAERWRLGRSMPVLPEPGECVVLPGAGAATLAELFAGNVRDSGWTGFLLPHLPAGKPWLWVQERMAILESGRLYPPGLGTGADQLIHVSSRDAREALWTMEEGLRCGGIGAVIGELYGDPQALDFTATRRLAVAAERHGVAAFLIRLGGHANLSGARFRWRIASAPSLANSLNPRAPGVAVWEAELFRARGHRPAQWTVSHEPGAGTQGGFRLVAGAGDRTLDEARRAAG